MKDHRSTFRRAALALGGAAGLAAIATAAHVDAFEAGPFRLRAHHSVAHDAQHVPDGRLGALGGVRHVTLAARGPGAVIAKLGPRFGDGPDDDSVEYRGEPRAEGALVLDYGRARDLDEDFLTRGDGAADHRRLVVDFDRASGPLVVGVHLVTGRGTDHVRHVRAVKVLRPDAGHVVFPYAELLALEPRLDLTDVDRVRLVVRDRDPRPTRYELAAFARR